MPNDKERLYFLLRKLEHLYYGEGGCFLHYVSHDDSKVVMGSTPRQAIDAAMRAEKGGK